MIKRFFFVIFFCLGGFLFYIPKWILFGTAAGRERKRLVKEQRTTNQLLAQAARRPQTTVISDDGKWWWDGQRWQPMIPA